MSEIHYRRIALDDFSKNFSAATELSSVALGGKVTSVSDEFFAEAFHLLLVEPAPSLKGQFGPKGALYSGWESRRHNPTYDWCIIKLGTTGCIIGFDIDTTHFNGNEAPQASVDALFSDSAEPPRANDSRWVEILPTVDLGPTSRHLFTIPKTQDVNYVKLNVFPDGGIARFRVYGQVAPVFPAGLPDLFDLAHVFAGGRVVFTSDQHFGVGSNLILPGRGKDMGDGWETKRSRQKGHKDWVIVKLGTQGYVDHVEIDTAHFKGNYPESCELHALKSFNLVPTPDEEQKWVLILPRTILGPHRRHFFHLDNVGDTAYSHVKLTIYPDGGVKRIRVMGRRIPGPGTKHLPLDETSSPLSGDAAAVSHVDRTLLPASGVSTIISTLPITPEAFAPFGQVIQAYSDVHATPRGIHVTTANQGTASKFHKLAPVESSYSSGMNATTNLSVFRSAPLASAIMGELELRILERHPYTNQAFIPMGRGKNTEDGNGLEHPGASYLVVVAQNGPYDKPDLSTLRAFTATAAQGIVYKTAIWHQPMRVLDRPMDFTVVETQIGNGEKADCEIVELDESEGHYRVKVAQPHTAP